MPELPEVESIIRGLQNTLSNLTVTNVTVLKGKIVSSKSNIRNIDDNMIYEFKKLLINSKFQSIKRVSKQLLIETDKSAIVVHLKMTGQLIHTTDETKINKHTCLFLELDDGSYLLYNDIRQFGYVLAFQNLDEASEIIDEYGFDPQYNIINQEEVYTKFSKSKLPLKQILLNQKVICGLGNIYADEVAFDSGILPSRIVNTVTKPEVKKLVNSITRIINHSIEEGGSSISDYILSDGSKGGYVKFHKVYGRKNKPCIICNSKLQTSVIASRTTVYCLKCQK